MYLVFAGDNYYPSGGAGDLDTAFEDMKPEAEVMAYATGLGRANDWVEVVKLDGIDVQWVQRYWNGEWHPRR